jgi:hypothetical protein
VRFIPFIPLKVQTALKTPKADEAKLSNFQTGEKKGKTFYTTLLEHLGSNLKRRKKTVLTRLDEKNLKTTEALLAILGRNLQRDKKIVSLPKDQKKLQPNKTVGKKLTPKGVRLKKSLAPEVKKNFPKIDLTAVTVTPIALEKFEALAPQPLPKRLEGKVKTYTALPIEAKVKEKNINLFGRKSLFPTFGKKVYKSFLARFKKENNLPLKGKGEPKTPIGERGEILRNLRNYKSHFPTQTVENLVSLQNLDDKNAESKNLEGLLNIVKNETGKRLKESNETPLGLITSAPAGEIFKHLTGFKKLISLKKVVKPELQNSATKVFSIKIPLEEETVLKIRMVKDSFYAKILTSEQKVNLLVQNLNQLTQQIANLGFSKAVINLQSISSGGGGFKQDNQRGNRDDNKQSGNAGKVEKINKNSSHISFSFYL